ncbi:MAG: alpha/beta fold hydrolase [Solirubrobacteraceae bacterium]
MSAALGRAAGLAYREAGPDGGAARGVALLVHGYPESSYMWRNLLPVLAHAGWRAIAPDLAGYGDSPVDRPGTWERHVDALGRFVDQLRLGPVALITHDWGVMIGLRWACENPGAACALVISDGGFFADRRWHDLANAMRTAGEGERLIAAYTREGLGAALRGFSRGITDDALQEYWKGFDGEERRMAQLDLYRSGDFEKLTPYESALARLGVPALIIWGGADRFASPAMAERFHAELAGSELEVFDSAGHFVWEDEPAGTAARVVHFLTVSQASAPKN